jgi:NAD(P)-dependent dehydrogenase (short-subunit alcohol dehydrogenase family)
MKRLASRIALVTGGNTGIGRAVALAYADEGADVAVCWIDREAEAKTLVAAIAERGRRALAVRADVTQEADVVARQRVERELGPPTSGERWHDAGSPRWGGRWDRMMNVTCAAFLCSREAAKHDATLARLDHQPCSQPHRLRRYRLLRRRADDRVHPRAREGARATILVNGVAGANRFDPRRRR